MSSQDWSPAMRRYQPRFWVTITLYAAVLIMGAAQPLMMWRYR